MLYDPSFILFSYCPEQRYRYIDKSGSFGFQEDDYFNKASKWFIYIYI